MTRNCWGPITPETWCEVPVIKHRRATLVDVHAGLAVFYIDHAQPGTVLPLELPKLAFQVNAETGDRTPVVVVQAEAASEAAVAGVRYVNGGSDVCLLRELEWVDDADISDWIRHASRPH